MGYASADRDGPNNRARRRDKNRGGGEGNRMNPANRTGMVPVVSVLVKVGNLRHRRDSEQAHKCRYRQKPNAFIAVLTKPHLSGRDPSR